MKEGPHEHRPPTGIANEADAEQGADGHDGGLGVRS
jgi:hypothetical protein